MYISIAPDVKIELVRVPAGEFWMGKFPVTVEQFAVFVSKSGYEMPDSKVSKVHNHPVRQVNWFDAQAFCKQASQVTQHTVRLPSEAEWEKAARGTDGRLWPWGNWQPKSDMGNFCMFRTLMTGSYPTPGPSQSIRGTSASDTTPVGRYSPEADSPYGCCDMAGNVWQWTNSLHRPYPYRDDDGRETDRDLRMRVVRGGSFLSHFRRVRCTSRLRQPPESRVAPDLGFRICLSVPWAEHILTNGNAAASIKSRRFDERKIIARNACPRKRSEQFCYFEEQSQ